MATTPIPPSSTLPQPLSYEQILGQQLSSYASAYGVNDLNTGSANVSFFQVVALMIARSSGDIFQVLRDFSLSRATGPALQNLAIEYGVTPRGAQVATGAITVTDLSFNKIFTTIYPGVNPPIVGATTIYASDASSFPPTGAIYIGRGTVNIEGPIAYSSTAQIGSYWSITLSAPTTKFHNIGESIILSQGGVRTVPVNTIVVSPGVGTTANVQYSVSQQGIILDGETTVPNIPIIALLPGSTGNVPAGSISQFASNPSGLSNANVTNPLSLTTGADTETDNQLRVRVSNALASTGLGTVTAIESALQGLQSPSSSNTIVSTDILKAATNTTVYIDNGKGYEATHKGVAIETIVNSALGGEKFFQLVTGGTQTSVTKAILQSVSAEPFNLSGGEVLTVVVENVTYNHTFLASDFANPGSATAYEVCASINGDTTLNYEAVTASGGTYIVIRPEDQLSNIIQVVTPASSQVVNANNFFQFPSQKGETLRLYKNGILLTEDGSSASIFTNSQALWSPTIASGETLSISVDGTQPITYTITNADFIAEGTYTTVSYSNSLQSWINVLNTKITGITATIVGFTIEISSNLGAINRASIKIVNTFSNPTSLISKGVINNNDLSSQGIASDYTLDRNTAQIQLVNALVAGDSLSAGTPITQANVKVTAVPSGSVTLSSDGHVWIAVDVDAIVIPTIITGSTLSVSQVGPNIVRYTTNSVNAFSNVIVGDYVIVWSLEIPSTDRLEGRVHAFTGSTLDIAVTVAEYTASTPILNASFIEGFVVVRTANVPQKFQIAAGTSTLDVIADELQSQTDELVFTVFQNQNIVVTSNTYNTTGKVTIVTADSFGALAGFVGGVTATSQDALVAFYETKASTSELPLFFHSKISADSFADPINSYVTNFNSTLSVAQFDPNEMIQFLDPYGGINDEQPALENVQMSAISGTSITLLPEYPRLRRVRTSDRFFVANPLDFGHNDTIVSIVDNNTIGETYTMPLFRTALVNSIWPPNNYSFDAYDVASGATASFATNFTGFDFSNFKVLMQPKVVIEEAAAQTALLYRSTLWGRSGEVINISYTYPSSANQGISSIVTVTHDAVNIAISLISGNPISSTIGPSTQWNVIVTPNTPVAGVDQVTYAWAGAYSFITGGVSNQYIFTVSPANATAGAVYTNNGFMYTVSSTIVAGTTLTTIGTGVPLPSGILTLFSGTGDATITFSSFAYGGYNATAGAVYTNNGHSFTITTTAVDAGTIIASSNSGQAPSVSGTLTKFSGTGDATIPFTSNTFVGIGSNPGLSLSGGGQYANISNLTGFNKANTGTFRISTVAGYLPSAITFTVQAPTGVAVAESNVVTGVSNGITFYSPSNTTAAAINTYVNANLSQYVTSTIVDDGGMTGSGVINFSTYEYTNFTIRSYYLKDGINWIASSNITGNPQFTLKEPLAYPTATGYSFFTSGEQLQLIPTTMDQVQRFWSILAVTGFTTVGNIQVVERGTKLQLATNTIGSIGSIQVVGGDGNEYSVPVLTSGQLIGLDEMFISANFIASQAVASDQWFRLQALNFQNKTTGFFNNTSVTVLSNTPVSGQSTLTALNQQTGQLYFGSPRNYTRVEGRTFRIENQGSLACLSWNGVGTQPFFSSPLNFNDSGGWTVNISSDGVYTVASGNTNFSELTVGDIITISGTVNPINSGTFFVQGVSPNGLSFSISNPTAIIEVGTAITAGEFSASSSVSEGDTVIINNPFSPLNQGQYRIVRMNHNSFWYENTNAVEEEITCVPNLVSTGYNASTVFNVTVSGGLEKLSWTGAGTQPFLGVTAPGDIVTFGSGFSSPNQGSFMVTDSGASQQQSVLLVMPAASTFSSSGPGDYFEIYSGGNVSAYYVWFNVSGGSNTDPAPFGFTGVEVTINGSDNATTVANETYNAIQASLPGLTSTVSGNIVNVVANLAAATNSPVNVSMPAAFSFIIALLGQTPFLTVINPAAVVQSGISSVTFSVDRPQLQFFPYEATVPGDKIVINGAILGAGNAGTYNILKILSPTRVVVAGIISQQYSTNLGGNYTSFSVQEGTAYTGYKQVLFVAIQPGTTTFNQIVFNTPYQYEKIDSSASVDMTSLGKLNFLTTIRSGIDSYNFDTDLIAIANRTIYGDPRDQITFPGVGAAGSDIFIREPLLKRIKIAVAIRTNIGVSFAQITNQIQSNVYALIQANPLGKSIDLSSIVETVRLIPGVTSVVLTSPNYNLQNDEIHLVTGEKAFIANLVTDISVSLIGN